MHTEDAATRIETQALIAGAWARGLADAFSLLGLPAVFLDAEGRVLHAGREALAHFGPFLAVEGRRLVVADPAGAGALAVALVRAGCGAPQRAWLGESGLAAHILAVPPAPGQILDRVVLLLEAGDATGESLAAAAIARLAGPPPLPLAH